MRLTAVEEVGCSPRSATLRTRYLTFCEAMRDEQLDVHAGEGLLTVPLVEEQAARTIGSLMVGAILTLPG